MSDFSLLTRKWYRQNKRDLPWRNTNDPYKIWLSEIILQQTRVDQGIKYYFRFIENYPSVYDLASASEQKVLNDWQGLGYYSRARNLHASSKYIVNELNGKFPSRFSDILQLKGVGNYTAAAISSFAFGSPHAVVDGNVYRLLSRFFDISEAIDSAKGIKLFQTLANELLDENYAGEHNQAVMELGAVVCTPRQPKCEECPLSGECQAIINNTVYERPVKAKRTKVRERFFHFFVIGNKDTVYLEQRTEKDIWKNMYQFPLIESSSARLPEIVHVTQGLPPTHMTHLLSHQKISAYFYQLDQLPKQIDTSNVKLFKTTDLEELPIPRLIDRYLETHPLNN